MTGDVALTRTPQGADEAPNGAKSERSPVRIRSGPPIMSNSEIIADALWVQAEPAYRYAAYAIYVHSA